MTTFVEFMSEQYIALARPGNENDCSELCFLILENHAIKHKILFKQILLYTGCLKKCQLARRAQSSLMDFFLGYLVGGVESSEIET